MPHNFLLILSFLGVTLLQGLQSKANETPLIVGTNAEFPPFSYLENKILVGFDIDIAKEVAKRLGKPIQFKDMPFDALIPAVVLNQVDFIAAGMSYTKERAKRVSFTRSYVSEDPLVILTTAKQPLLSLDSLKGKTVIVIEGFTADLFLSAKPEIQLTRLPTQADGFIALKSGRADAFVTAKSTVNTFFTIQDASQFYTTEILGAVETCALVVPKDKTTLLTAIQIVLDDMEKEGAMATLKAQWKLP